MELSAFQIQEIVVTHYIPRISSNKTLWILNSEFSGFLLESKIQNQLFQANHGLCICLQLVIVRQSLFTFQDSVAKKPKAQAAADAIKLIAPMVETRHVLELL